jgi:hypothetical protein
VTTSTIDVTIDVDDIVTIKAEATTDNTYDQDPVFTWLGGGTVKI